MNGELYKRASASFDKLLDDFYGGNRASILSTGFLWLEDAYVLRLFNSPHRLVAFTYADAMLVYALLDSDTVLEPWGSRSEEDDNIPSGVTYIPSSVSLYFSNAEDMEKARILLMKERLAA